MGEIRKQERYVYQRGSGVEGKARSAVHVVSYCTAYLVLYLVPCILYVEIIRVGLRFTIIVSSMGM